MFMFYSYNMGTSNLPEMYAQSPRAQSVDCMLQLLCNSSVEANSLTANTSTSTGFFLYACVKGVIMVMQQVTL